MAGLVGIHAVTRVVLEADEANVNQDLDAGFILLAVSTDTRGDFLFLLGDTTTAAQLAPPAAPAEVPA